MQQRPRAGVSPSHTDKSNLKPAPLRAWFRKGEVVGRRDQGVGFPALENQGKRREERTKEE